MEQNKIYVGVDISAASFAASKGKEVREFKNTPSGFSQLVKWAGSQATHVMEASGPYYLALAWHLHEAGHRVCVVNPLVIRRYSQMVFARAKTDRKDAQLIEAYGREQSPSEWTPPSKAVDQLAQILSAIRLLEKMRRQSLNHRGANKANPKSLDQVQDTLSRAEQCLKDEVEQLQREAQKIVELEFKEEDDLLQSIPGIGQKVAFGLLVFLSSIERFETAKQVQAYFGLSPRIYQSGTSVRGRGSLCKLGQGEMRRLLYLAALTASRRNPQCKAMYDRMIACGKKKKVALCAVAAKVLRQAFAVLKHKKPFSAEVNLALFSHKN
jgi:transposase